ncbi:MAG: HDOD domain-containing protein [Treponema sp.]|nr:HDOD domain-containing protein [Treponema sp.]
MMQKNLTYKIKNYILEMPSLPVSAGKVLEVCNSINVNPSELNKVISLDPVLTGKMLQLINSAYYGLGTHITSLIKAITMLGLNTVKNMVLSTAILSILPKNKDIDGLNMEGFWHHSLCVGVMSKLLAVKQGVDSKYLDEYFTAGLLHDLGKISLNAVMTSDYIRMVTDADMKRVPLIEVENEILGINHQTAGEMIAKAWKLDSTVLDVITHHHDVKNYTGANGRLVCTAAIANYFSLVYEVGFAGDRKPEKPDSEAWNITGFNEDVFLDIMEKLYSEIERAKVFLHIS